MEENAIKRTVKGAMNWRCPTAPLHIVIKKKEKKLGQMKYECP